MSYRGAGQRDRQFRVEIEIAGDVGADALAARRARQTLLRFRDLGVAISMDDYGTGQSTRPYLKKLPLSELKIDRSFVQHAHQDRNDALLVRSTVELAHQLGLKVVAEGIEEAECLAFLRSIGRLCAGLFWRQADDGRRSRRGGSSS